MTSKPIVIAFKAHLGWVAAVGVLARRGGPAPVFAERIDFFEGADRETIEPYHVAGGWHGLKQTKRPADPQAIIRRGRRKQVTAARKHLALLRDTLEADGLNWERSVLLTGRGYVGNLAHKLSSHAHIHIAEGEAVRAAVRNAHRDLDIPLIGQDEKSIAELATARLKSEEAEVEQRLKALKPEGAKSWRKEDRLLALGAWLNL